MSGDANEIPSEEVKRAVEALKLVCGDESPEELIEDAKLFIEDAKNFVIGRTPELDKYFINKSRKLRIK